MICAAAQSNDFRLQESRIFTSVVLKVNPIVKSPLYAENVLNAWYMPPLICQYYGIDKVRSYHRSCGIEVYPAETPLSVRGARFFARGILHDDAVLKFEIYPTTEEGEFVFEPIAVAECAVSDMIVTPDGDMNIYEIPFKLAKEIELSSETSPYYLVGITGFYGAAEWLAPYQSERPNQYELALGYYRCTVNYGGKVDDWWMWHVANFENEYGEMYSTFAICLDAAYPWTSDPWTSGIGEIMPDRIVPTQCFDLQGRKISSHQHGFIIHNGQKILRH